MEQTTFVNLLKDPRQFQFLLDKAAEVFEPSVWKRYFNYQFTPSLSWKTITGVAENPAAASVTSYGSPSPRRTRPTVGKVQGTIPSLKTALEMNPEQVRDMLELQKRVDLGVIGIEQMIEYIYPDIKNAAVGPHKRLDLLVLEGMSKGTITLDSTTNPDGIVFDVNLGITTTQTASTWDTTGTDHTPLKDIRTIYNTWKAKGVIFRNMKMSRATFNALVNATEVTGALSSFDLRAGAKTTRYAPDVVTVDMLNTYLLEMGLPNVELIDVPVRVENPDGTFTTIYPFADDRVLFSVDDDFGRMFYSFTNEGENPIPTRTYANNDNVLVKRWVQDNAEVTEGELVAFPAFNAVKQMAIFNTVQP